MWSNRGTTREKFKNNWKINMKTRTSRKEICGGGSRIGKWREVMGREEEEVVEQKNGKKRLWRRRNQNGRKLRRLRKQTRAR